jgi:hypothetical protein
MIIDTSREQGFFEQEEIRLQKPNKHGILIPVKHKDGSKIIKVISFDEIAFFATALPGKHNRFLFRKPAKKNHIFVVTRDGEEYEFASSLKNIGQSLPFRFARISQQTIINLDSNFFKKMIVDSGELRVIIETEKGKGHKSAGRMFEFFVGEVFKSGFLEQVKNFYLIPGLKR